MEMNFKALQNRPLHPTTMDCLRMFYWSHKQECDLWAVGFTASAILAAVAMFNL